MMHTLELWKMGKSHVPSFKGVYPLDKIPSNLIPPANFIVNTHTHNLPGEHWIAVSYLTRGIVFAFDPFGMYYPQRLKKYLVNLDADCIDYNKIQFQGIFEKTCGDYCIAWLIYLNHINPH